MDANVGELDRIIRIVAGVALLTLLIFLDGPGRWFGLVGLIPLATGLISFCPLYPIFGFSTAEKEN